MRVFRYVFFRLFPFLAVYALIFYLSSKQMSELPSNIPDIIPHFIEYFVLSFSFMRLFGLESKINIFTVIIIVFILSVLDEVHQIYVPTRNFSYKDMAIDLFAIIIGVYIYRGKLLNFLK